MSSQVNMVLQFPMFTHEKELLKLHDEALQVLRPSQLCVRPLLPPKGGASQCGRTRYTSISPTLEERAHVLPSISASWSEAIGSGGCRDFRMQQWREGRRQLQQLGAGDIPMDEFDGPRGASAVRGGLVQLTHNPPFAITALPEAFCCSPRSPRRRPTAPRTTARCASCTCAVELVRRALVRAGREHTVRERPDPVLPAAARAPACPARGGAAAARPAAFA